MEPDSSSGSGCCLSRLPAGWYGVGRVLWGRAGCGLDDVVVSPSDALLVGSFAAFGVLVACGSAYVAGILH